MSSLIRTFTDPLFRVYAQRRTTVDVQPGTRVNWLALRHTVGGKVTIGKSSIVHCRIAFDHPGGEVRIGDRCYIGASHLVCHSGIRIGNDVIISWGVTIVDHDSHSVHWQDRSNDVADWMTGRKDWSKVAVAPVTVADKVWIGFGASLLKGVTVGEGSVVAANTVVTKDVAPYSLVAGNPCRVIRSLDP